MSAANDNQGSDDEPPTAALALTMAGVFFFGSYFSSTVVHEVLGRRGLPVTPLAYAVAFLPATFGIIRYEEQIQQTRHWPAIERFWYGGVVSAGMVAPAVATGMFPRAVGRSLPRGAPSGIALTLSIAAPILAIARGLSARKKSERTR